MSPFFTVSVHDIDTAGLARSFDLPLSWFTKALAEDTDIEATEPGHADLRLSKTGPDVVVRGNVTATIAQPCARCLTPTVTPVAGELSLLLRPARHETQGARDARQSSQRQGEEYEFSAQEADQDVYEGDQIVLDDLLREAVLLEVPSFPLCSEDCPGIRPLSKTAPRRQEALDPRLIPLKALKTKLKLAPGPTPHAGEGPQPDVSPAVEIAPERALLPRKTARPTIPAHRTKANRAGAGGAKKSKSKTSVSPKKKAK